MSGPKDGSPATRRLDESMTLLREAMERPLDPGYAAAAAARAARAAGTGAGAGRRRPSVVMVTVLVAALCGLLTTWAVVELRRPEPGGVAARRALEREIQRRTDHADAAQRANAQLRATIATEQARALSAAGDADQAARITALGAVAGELPVSGPGLVLTLDDAPSANATPAGPRDAANPEEGRVLDRDLQIVVNGLWAAGAEAVSVNDQRLNALSAIRSAGQAILVDYRPLAPPYTVKVLGDPSRLEAGFARDLAGPYLQALRDNYGIQTSIVAKDRLSVDGGGAIHLRYASAVPGDSASPTPGAAVSSPPPSVGPSAASAGPFGVRRPSAREEGFA